MLGLIVRAGVRVQLFGAFFTAFFYIRYTNYPVYPPEPFEMRWTHRHHTAILVSSSFTMHWALVSIKRGNRRGLTLGLLFTLIMGLTFLALRSASTTCCTRRGFTPEHGAFASIFFGLTACTASRPGRRDLLSIALLRTLRGHYSPEKHMASAVRHLLALLDVVWVVLYTLVYLLSTAPRAALAAVIPARRGRGTPRPARAR